MKPFHAPKVLSINKERVTRTAYLKAMTHPGTPAWVAEHGGNRGGFLSSYNYRKQIIFAAALIEDGKTCRWHYAGWTQTDPTEVHEITGQAGFSGLGDSNPFYANRAEKAFQELKDFLIVHSGKFLDRMPLYINHRREDIRYIARKVLSGK